MNDVRVHVHRCSTRCIGGQPAVCPECGLPTCYAPHAEDCELGKRLESSEHDWSGAQYTREMPGGALESGVTCAKCGMEFGHWALFNLD